MYPARPQSARPAYDHPYHGPSPVFMSPLEHSPSTISGSPQGQTPDAYQQQFHASLSGQPGVSYGSGRGVAMGAAPSPPPVTSGGGGPLAYFGGTSGVRASVACDACRKRKVKCTVVHPQQQGSSPLGPLSVDGVAFQVHQQPMETPQRICVRCARLGIDCTWKDEKKGGKSLKSATSNPSMTSPTKGSHSTPSHSAAPNNLEVVFEAYNP
ncbi:hypothetical protein DL93DRAFT_695416 [Clavulina sp. PMI_390]|nr:hypothetical protein DL93DRAFT_695416 [Clavulina sp. PMI_390]